MDPVTQGLLGAGLSQSFSKPKYFGSASLLGLLSGMAPDLDVFIRSSQDPLLFLEYHRQFTHSLFFIPIGGLICALFLHYLFFRKHLPFSHSYLYCTLAYATHALLDSCTSYGTQLLWPFSHYRVAWDTVSVIDPLVTLPLAALTLLSLLKRSHVIAMVAMVWVVVYQAVGFMQNQRAISAVIPLIESANHIPKNLTAKPSFANIVLWKVIYEYDGNFYNYAVHAGTSIKTYRGAVTKKLATNTDFPWLDEQSQQARDIERFRWFSQGYLAVDQQQNIIDARYSLLPTQASGLWGISLSEQKKHNQHVDYFTRRDFSSEQKQQFFAMLFGKNL